MDAASKYFTKGATFWYDAMAAFADKSYLSLRIDHFVSLMSITSKHFTRLC